ncbi:MAG TPA: VOC family protein [Candidatus Thermoplasmatota archaeon]|nr:VOC family protein [Candidatus Thermoplasmatota archaeon]
MTSTCFSLTVIFVEDIQISKSFYQHLFDFTIKHDFGKNIVFKEGLSIWQKNRAQTIIFGKNQVDTGQNIQKQTELYFETDEIENIFSKIKQHSEIKVIHDLKQENWGQKTVRIFDPDDFIIEIAEPMNHVVKRYDAKKVSIQDISHKTQLPINEIKRILNK